MIYSSWRPDSGGYDYFETAERRGFGDDLPIPNLRARSPIGVASTSIGRTPGGPLRAAGSGELARGSIMPLSKARLNGVAGGDDAAALSKSSKVAAVLAVGVVLYIVYRASEDSLSLKKLFQ